MDVIGFELDLIVLQSFEFVAYMIIYSAGVVGFEVDLIVLQGFVHTPPPLYQSGLRMF